jgi:hypothetical protein
LNRLIFLTCFCWFALFYSSARSLWRQWFWCYGRPRKLFGVLIPDKLDIPCPLGLQGIELRFDMRGGGRLAAEPFLAHLDGVEQGGGFGRFQAADLFHAVQQFHWITPERIV